MPKKVWLLVATAVSLALASCAPSKPSATTSPAPTPTATVNALKTPLPSQGWVTVPALAFAKNIAFSKGDPFTGYACGNIGIGVARTPADVLQLSVTRDGGRTWSTPVATTVPGAGCNFSINPANASDLVMMAWGCYVGCNHYPAPYRSRDGGTTWEALKLDPTQWQNNTNVAWTESDPAWVGNTPYFAIVAPGAHGPIPQPLHAVVSNTSDGVLSAADAGIYSIVTDPWVYPNSIWTFSSTLVVSFDVNNYMKSADGGVTWQRFTPNLPPLPPSSSGISSTDGELVIEGSGGWQVSSDGGITWQLLPSLPPTSSVFRSQGLVHTPDGTFIAVGPVNIWLLAPGASAWQDAAKMVTDQYGIPVQVLGFSTDAVGHPLLAWSQASRSTYVNGTLQPGIAYHGLEGS